MINRWLFSPVPLGRIAALRTLAYAFIPIDVLFTTRWVLSHKDVPTELYQPLYIGRLLPLPTPTHNVVAGICIALLVTTVAAAFNRAPRVLGIAVFLLYFEWMIIAMSYGKVDHDRFAFLVLLAVLPTIGRARWGDVTQLSEKAGWAVRLTQIAVVCTYFFAAWAKLRFGGIDWLNSATLTRAVLRRGTDFSRWTLDFPWILTSMQWFIVAFELLSPIVLFIRSDRLRTWVIGGFYAFHAMVFATIRIIFLPHLVAMAAFLPLERVRPIEWTRSLWSRRQRIALRLRQRTRRRPPGQAMPVSGDQPV